MTEFLTCECETDRWCDRRGCVISRLHQGLCQQGGGKVETIDECYGPAGSFLQRKPIRTQPSVTKENRKKQALPKKQSKVSKIGDNLKAIIRRDTGQTIPCSRCRAEIDKLNTMTVEQVLKDIPRLSSLITKNGQKTAPKIWQRIACATAPKLVSSRIVEPWILEACDMEKAK